MPEHLLSPENLHGTLAHFCETVGTDDASFDGGSPGAWPVEFRQFGRAACSATWYENVLDDYFEATYAASSPASDPITVLGIDDFSFKRGRTFGTILVNLSTHQVIDLLSERTVESAAAWMQSHPEIAYVSRDRGNDYAQAARMGLPKRLQ